MNRYFYYLVFINAFTDVIVFAPQSLISQRHDGALMSIALVIPFGTLLLCIYSKAMQQFPALTLPEILKQTVPVWVQKGIILLIFPVWYISGIMMLSAVTQIYMLLVNPDMPSFVTVAVMTIVIIVVVRYPARSILLGLEVFFWIFLILMGYVLVKAMIDWKFNWTQVLDAAGYLPRYPSLIAFAGASYTFTGYTDMFSFNKEFKHSYTLKLWWLFPAGNLILLLMAFFIPIGYLGLEAAGEYKYPFITASDAITMKMGIVERVYFFFLVLYILLSIVNIIIHWKVTYDLLEGMLRHQFQVKNLKRAGWWCIAVFGILPLLITGIFNDQQIIFFGEYWLTMRIAAEMFAVILIASLAISVRRRKRKAIV